MTKSWSYDSGDRLVAAAGGGVYVYDAFGRVTTLPANDTPTGTGAISLGYYDDDSVKSITQNGTTTAFNLDPAGRRSTSTTTPPSGAGTTIVRHYTDGSDNPGWTSTTTGTSGSTVERYAETLDGNLGLTLTGLTGAVSLSVVDLHGDNLAQIDVPTTGDATGLGSWNDTDEYGNPLTASATGTTPANTGGTSDGLGYGWLGGKQRATDGSGLVLMGERLYNPVSAAFTSTDPVYGGNTTAYAYPQDPVNGYDLDGRTFNDNHSTSYLAPCRPTPPAPSKKKEHRSGIGGFFHSVTHNPVTRAATGVAKQTWKHKVEITGTVAFGACIVGTGGACAVAGGVAASVSIGVNANKVRKGKMSVKSFALNTTLDIAGSRFKALREAGPNYDFQSLGRAFKRHPRRTVLRGYRQTYGLYRALTGRNY